MSTSHRTRSGGWNERRKAGRLGITQSRQERRDAPASTAEVESRPDENPGASRIHKLWKKWLAGSSDSTYTIDAIPLPGKSRTCEGVRKYHRERAEALRRGEELPPSHKERAIALIRQKKGVLRASDFAAIGIPSIRIAQLCDEGTLVKIAYGLYREADPNLPKPDPDEARALRLRGGPNGKSRDRVLALLRKKGEARACEFAAVGVTSSYLAKLCDEGTIVRVGRGRYREGDPSIGNSDRERAKAERMARRMAGGPSLRERAVAIARERGEVRTSEFTAIGIPRCYLARMCDEGLLVKIGYGRYRAVYADVACASGADSVSPSACRIKSVTT